MFWIDVRDGSIWWARKRGTSFFWLSVEDSPETNHRLSMSTPPPPDSVLPDSTSIFADALVASVGLLQLGSGWRDVALGGRFLDWNCGWFSLRLLATPLISFPGTRRHLSYISAARACLYGVPCIVTEVPSVIL